LRQDMKLFGWLIISLVVVLTGYGQVFAADNASMAWSNSEWGNTSWGDTSWRNTDWGSTNWGSTDWGNTGWDHDVQQSQHEYPGKQLNKVTLGIKKPDSSCFLVVMWEKSSGDAISAVAKNCQGCIISDLMSSDAPETETGNVASFCQ